MQAITHTLQAGTTATLRSLGQIIFQENALSGALILLGIAWNNASMLFPCLLATVISLLTAYLSGFSKAAISQGLYGFNGALVGLAVAYFCELNGWSYALLVGGAVITTLIAHFLATRTPIKGFTFPFVLTTWGLLAVATALDLPKAEPQSLLSEGFNLVAALSLSFGQIMFQDTTLAAGLCFFLAILVNNPSQSLLALLSVGLSCGVLCFSDATAEPLSAGLYGYNVILCAVAVGSFSRKGLLRLLVAVFLSVVFQQVGRQQGIIMLTAPFVFAVWGVLVWDKLTGSKQ